MEEAAGERGEGAGGRELERESLGVMGQGREAARMLGAGGEVGEGGGRWGEQMRGGGGEVSLGERGEDTGEEEEER